MRKYQCGLLLVLLSVCLGPSGAADYYVAKTGSDSNTGSMADPFLTVQRAVRAMAAGDTCYVRQGVYRETVQPALTGRMGLPIRFLAYPGEEVTVSGGDPVTGWSQYSGSIYRAYVGTNKHLSFEGTNYYQLFCDGAMMTEARWPNTGSDLMRPTQARMAAGSNATSIVDPNLNQPAGTWEGALLHMTPGAHVISFTTPVTTYDPVTHTINFAANPRNTPTRRTRPSPHARRR